MAVDPVTAKVLITAAQTALKSKPVQYFIAGMILICLLLGTMIFGFSFSFVALLQQQASTSLSDKGIDFLERHEGFSPVPYRGVDYQNETIGYGHVIQPGENYTYLSVDEADLLFRQDLQRYEKSVKDEFKDVPLSTNQYDALVSLCYNLGVNIWPQINLTDDVKANASADVIEADFLRLDHVNGEEVEGLKNRRQAEYDIFENGDYDK